MFNQVITIGNLTKDNELKYLPSGSAILNGSIATSHKYKKQNGEQVDEVCFIDFTIFGKAAEIFNQYTHKGSKVMLESRLTFQQWKAQDGTNRSRHILTVNEFKFLDGKSEPQQNGHTQQNQQMQNNQQYQQNVNQGNQMVNDRNGYEQNIPNIDNDQIPH